MARTLFFVALRGLLTLFLLDALVRQPYTFAAAHTHAPSQRDIDETFSAEARAHKLIKRSASAQPLGGSEGWSLVPKDYIADEILAERSGDEPSPTKVARSNSLSAWNNGRSIYQQLGTSGVAAMQLSVVTDRYVILFDKAEHNPLKTSDGINAWSALLNTQAQTVRALKLITNSFCAVRTPGFIVLRLRANEICFFFAFDLFGNSKAADGSATVHWPTSVVTHVKVSPPRMVLWLFGFLLPTIMVQAKFGRTPPQ